MKTKWYRGEFPIHSHIPGEKRTGLIDASNLFGISGNVVTHIPTGLSFGNAGFPTRAQAKEFVAAVADLLDWSKVTFENQPETLVPFGEQIKALRNQHGY